MWCGDWTTLIRRRSARKVCIAYRYHPIHIEIVIFIVAFETSVCDTSLQAPILATGILSVPSATDINPPVCTRSSGLDFLGSQPDQTQELVGPSSTLAVLGTRRGTFDRVTIVLGGTSERR